MSSTQTITRRTAIRTLAGGAAALSCASTWAPSAARAADAVASQLKGNIKHSVSKWCYGKIPLDEFCGAVKAMGIASIELLGPRDWPTVQKHGLTCAMCNGPDSIGYGWNRVEHHDKLVAAFERAIPEVARFGFPNIITFSGNRRGMDDATGIKHCVQGLKRIVGVAEKHKVTIAMELLNSKVDHADYMADHTAWGVEVCKQVGSDRFKLLYDIYHMQIMEGDLIRTIQQSHPCIAHYHTGGNPGRNEIDATQEIFYPAVMRAILKTGFHGYVGQEFVPKRDPLTSLREAVRICDV
ncbi:MAG: TIM barrel protein [Verrucomicrobia bacterium]|nr:TIM barrel protein [Verrucomicrobiota bacterium]